MSHLARILLVAALLAPSLARADEALTPSTPAAADVTIAATAGLSADAFVAATVGLEVGRRIDGDWWGHGALRLGAGGDAEGSGDHLEVRAGVDRVRCARDRVVCGVVGLDLGYVTSSWEGDDRMTESHSGPLVAPRVGVEFGGAHLRARFMAEARGYYHSASTPSGDTTRFEPGVGFGASLGYQL
ncbi:MAG: hypothetical protein IPL61_28430 [Myxococcales bacterium]|nr:hypothetical protein [Myxococcales bacterium]